MDMFAALSKVLDQTLAADGFENIRPRRWVRSTKVPIREILEYQAMKGATYSPRWGFSLDFVPLFRNGKFVRKPTTKSAEFDLCIDPIDETGQIPADLSLRTPIPPWTRKAYVNSITETARRVVALARFDFARVQSVRDVIALYEERAAMKFQRFSLDNYAQTHLGWGLALIATGQTPEGQAHIDGFCTQFHIGRDQASIVDAVTEAANLSPSKSI